VINRTRLDSLSFQELENEEVQEEIIETEEQSGNLLDDTTTTQNKTSRKRKYISKPARKKKLGDQLTYQSEQNVLAEIDIYAFLGKVYFL